VAEGLDVMPTAPPAPPLAEPTATLEPPMAEVEPRVPNERLRAGPPAPETPTATPPLPPRPPRATMSEALTAAPVPPDAELLVALAPELATLLALPTARAGPVFPEFPELPDTAPPPMATAVPRMPELVAVGFDVAAPVLPVLPELPETATGLLTACDDAGPVFPVLVALDCDDEDPEFPDLATGATLTVAPPLEPPLADVWDTLEPPVAVLVPTVPTDTFAAGPPAPDAAAATPPPPPLPPAAITVVWLTAAPVAPEPEVEPEPAPDEALLVAPPVATAGPVEPELPEPPETIWAPDGADCRSSMAKTAAVKAKMAQPSRLMFRMVAIFMRITSLPTWSLRPAPAGPRFRHPQPVVKKDTKAFRRKREEGCGRDSSCAPTLSWRGYGAA
jgi:hypothetical protein